MSTFHRDNAFQLEVRDRVLVPFYERQYEAFFFCDHTASPQLESFKWIGIDTVAVTNGREGLLIDEKITRWPGHVWGSFCLETWSNSLPGEERKGWMYTSLCNRIHYGFLQEDGSLRLYSLDFRRLRRFFFRDHYYKRLPKFQTKTRIRTRGRLAPIVMVERDVGFVWEKWLEPDGSERNISPGLVA